VKRKTELASKAPAAKAARLRVWDRPVRLFHWAIVILIALAWWTAKQGEMTWHRPIGYAIAGLLAFRLWWGVAGGSTARFSDFVKGPRAVAAYARSLARPDPDPGPPGHNPMGGWSVVALLGVLIAEVGLGLFSVDVDGDASGPLADRVSFETGRLAAHWHHWLFNGLLGLIGLHLCAIAFYALVKRDNLVGPMLTGSKPAPPGTKGLVGAPWWRFWMGVALAVVVAGALASGLRFGR
jgi:cytochrome b